MNIIYQPSPNQDLRDFGAPDILVLHYTGMPSGPAAIDWLCNPDSRVSSHYVVEEDGRIFGLVPENMRAWHAGVSHWRGTTALNNSSIGIEIVNPGHEWGYRAFPPAQMAAVEQLCRDILQRHKIPPRNVVGHSDIAPSRKIDPGELFDWPALARAGIGLMPPPPRTCDGEVLEFGAQGPDVTRLQTDLGAFGYGLPATGIYDGDTVQTVRAFQRHFKPLDLSGAADGATRDILAQLLGMV